MERICHSNKVQRLHIDFQRCLCVEDGANLLFRHFDISSRSFLCLFALDSSHNKYKQNKVYWQNCYSNATYQLDIGSQQSPWIEDRSSLSVSRVRRLYRRLATHWRNSRAATIWVTLFFLANVAAFSYKAAHYAYNREDATAVFGPCIVFARGAANCLNLNCALILLPVSRTAMTRLRVAKVVPLTLPPEVDMHIWLGSAILLWTVLHVGAHMVNVFKIS